MRYDPVATPPGPGQTGRGRARRTVIPTSDQTPPAPARGIPPRSADGPMPAASHRRLREVGTLWVGGPLSWLEQLCLKSFVDHGQPITLFTYAPVPNVPAGVIRRDGREILDTDDFLRYERKDSLALFADLFRIHMIAARPGLVWVDTDVYCHRPMTYASDTVMGFELPGGTRVNNAVLGLAADGAIVADMLAFMADRHSIAPYLPARLREDYARAAAAGAAVHVGRQPWGVWGPMMLSHFAARHGLLPQVQPMEAFYPVPFPERLKFLHAARKVERRLTPETTALHLWASNKRELGLRHDGLPPEGSFLAALVARHRIDAPRAAVAGRGRRVFAAGLLDATGLSAVTRFTDVGGGAAELALAAHARWGCGIDLVDLDHRGHVPPEPSAWVAPYRERLAAAGVPAERIRRVGVPAPAELVANLAGFGDAFKVRHLDPVLRRLAPGTCLLTDIRKGSGAWPHLRPYGTLRILSTRSDAGVEVSRCLLVAGGAEAAPVPRRRPEAKTGRDAPRAPHPEPEPWPVLAARLAGAGGFVRDDGQHSFLHIPRGDTLVVTFDNLDIAMEKRSDRRPWGHAFIERQGWSMLGVMANGWTWYRDPWVPAQFEDLAASGLFARYRRVVFYGASMGGYAACAFAAACPGAEVVAISPQSTLDRTLVPWETRYKAAWGRDFSGPYGDAARASAKAARVTLLYDPYEPLDAAHAARFDGANVVKLRAPLMGHRLGSSLHQMGILMPVTLGALDGSLTEGAFYRLLRARKTFPRYQREIFKRALATGHPDLARRLARWVLTRGDHRYIRKALTDLEDERRGARDG